MPHKLTRHRRLLRYKPFGFSPFARSIAQLASDNKVKRKIYNGLQEKKFPSSSGNGVLNHTQGGKNQHSDSSDDEFEGTLQADFEFFDPKPDDFHGVKVLLQTYLNNKQWDLSGFVDLILGQPTVGTVVKIANDEDEGIYSVISALNLGRYKNSKCIMELKKFLLSACQDKNVQANLSSLLEEQSNDVGLLVSQRVVNLPPQLLPPLYDGLFDEISWATEDEPTEELRKSFCFKFYLVVSKIYKHKNADKKTLPSKSGDEAIIYVKPEEEILHELSSWSFTFPMHSQPVRTDELKDYRMTGLVMAVEASKISKFRKQLNSLIDNS
nr:protein BCCIP homolog [Ipomoea batatas]